MITGVDYILCTWKNKDAFSKEIEQSFIWCNPHLVIEYEDETTDIYLSENKEMFDLMEEKGFYTNKDSGEGPFLIIFNDSYMKECNRITLVLLKDIDTSKFARELFDWLKSII